MKKWVKVEDVSRLRDGQRIRMYFGGSGYDTASTRYGGDGCKPLVYRQNAVETWVGTEQNEITGPSLERWTYGGYTVEVLKEEVDERERTRVAKAWNRLELSLCEVVQLTPTQWLSSRRWAVVELMMREIEATIAELRTEAGDGAAPTVGTAERSASRSAQNGEGVLP